MRITVAALVFVAAAAAVTLHASDRTGVYALVDKVVFEPSADKPERVQIWGAFAIAKVRDQDLYDPAKRGYLYFAVSESAALTRNEWNDLKALVGSKRIAAFSSRFAQSVRLRAENEAPANPDKYVLGTGVQTIQPDRDYAPIKDLAAHITR